MLTFLSGHEALKVYCFLWNVVENQKKENLSEGQINRKHSDKHVNIFSEMSKNKVKISIMKSFFGNSSSEDKSFYYLVYWDLILSCPFRYVSVLMTDCSPDRIFVCNVIQLRIY